MLPQRVGKQLARNADTKLCPTSLILTFPLTKQAFRFNQLVSKTAIDGCNRNAAGQSPHIRHKVAHFNMPISSPYQHTDSLANFVV